MESLKMNYAYYEHDIREDSYSISYEQLTSLNMHMVQKTIKRVDKHDEDIMSIRHSMSNYENDTEQLRKEVDTLRK